MTNGRARGVPSSPCWTLTSGYGSWPRTGGSAPELPTTARCSWTAATTRRGPTASGRLTPRWPARCERAATSAKVPTHHGSEGLTMARWEDDAEKALTDDGYTIIDSAQNDDYQGWGVRLGSNAAGLFAVLSWSYGSCSGCDRYEDM